MLRGVYIHRASGERLTLKVALARYQAEVTPTKRPSTQTREKRLAALTRNWVTILSPRSRRVLWPPVQYRHQGMQPINIFNSSNRLGSVMLYRFGHKFNR